MSCHYWLLRIKYIKCSNFINSFGYFGFQSLGENLIMSNQCLMNRQTSRQMITSIDSWHDLKEEDIRRMEIECMEKLKEMIQSSELSQAYAVGM